MSENNQQNQGYAPMSSPAPAPGSAPAYGAVPTGEVQNGYTGYSPAQTFAYENVESVNLGYNEGLVQPVQVQDGPLTGGKKFAWFAVGFLMSAPGVLIAWLMYQDFPQRRKDGFKFSLIGALAMVVLVVINVIIATVMMATMVSVGLESIYGLSGESYGLYGDYFGSGLY